MSRILLVEDDADIARHTKRFLEKDGFAVHHIDNGGEVLDWVKREQPDLILLDLMLPEKDGISCCVEIRQFSDIPIIMVTAKVEEIDRLLGLQIGADDYVCKPFSAAELSLRCTALLRRAGWQAQETLGFEMDEGRQTVRLRDNEAELTSVEFNLLAVLYRQAGNIYSRAQLLDLAYGDYRDISDRAVDSHIKNLRRKLKQLDPEHEFIESVYGAGYRLQLPGE